MSAARNGLNGPLVAYIPPPPLHLAAPSATRPPASVDPAGIAPKHRERIYKLHQTFDDRNLDIFFLSATLCWQQFSPVGGAVDLPATSLAD